MNYANQYYHQKIIFSDRLQRIKISIVSAKFFSIYAYKVKITLLGTGANECIPAFNCVCPVCANAEKTRGKEIRQNSCALVEDSMGKSILIDMPPQITTLLTREKINSTSIDNILFTHRHEDHILGARYLFQGSSQKGFVVENKTNLYMPQTAFKAMSGKFLYNKASTELNMNTENYKIHFIESYKCYFIAEMTITPLDTNHLDESFGYMIKESKGKTAVYLLDAAREIPEKTVAILEQEQIDLIVVDCTFKKTNRTSCHLDIEGAIELNRIIKPGRMILSHIGHQNLTHSELVSTMSPHNIEVGYDGKKILL